MDEDDILLTSLVFLDVIGEVKSLCEKAVNSQLKESELTAEGQFKKYIYFKLAIY